MSRPLTGARLTAAMAAALLIGGCGSGTPASQSAQSGDSSSTARHVVARVVPNATLGSAGFFPFGAKGFGSPHPALISNGGDPVGIVHRIRWRNWGAPTATGKGSGSAAKPNGGYYHRPVVIELRAEQLGNCRGRPGYHRLFSRRQRRPHGQFDGWHSWWPPPHNNICGYSGNHH